MRIEFAYVPGSNNRAIGVVVVVKQHVLNDDRLARDVRQQLGRVRDFRGLSVTLMATEGRGRVRYLGDPKLVRQLAGIDALALPWRTATIAA